jgi:hypothetical protein
MKIQPGASPILWDRFRVFARIAESLLLSSLACPGDLVQEGKAVPPAKTQLAF